MDAKLVFHKEGKRKFNGTSARQERICMSIDKNYFAWLSANIYTVAK